MDTLPNNAIPPEIMAMMEEAARHAVTGRGDPEILRQIHERAEQVRQEILEKHGVLDIGVPSIRELRDGEDE